MAQRYNCEYKVVWLAYSQFDAAKAPLARSAFLIDNIIIPYCRPVIFVTTPDTNRHRQYQNTDKLTAIFVAIKRFDQTPFTINTTGSQPPKTLLKPPALIFNAVENDNLQSPESFVPATESMRSMTTKLVERRWICNGTGKTMNRQCKVWPTHQPPLTPLRIWLTLD